MVCRTAGDSSALPLQLGLQLGDACLFVAVADYGLQTVSDLSALPLQIMVCRTVMLVCLAPSQIMVCRTAFDLSALLSQIMVCRTVMVACLAPSQIMVCRTAGDLSALPLQLGMQVGDACLPAAVAEYGLRRFLLIGAPLRIMVCRMVMLFVYRHSRLWFAGRLVTCRRGCCSLV